MMNEVYALIYNRVSSPQQIRDGHGMESQELRNKQYCDQKNYIIEAIFNENAITGGDKVRKEFTKLLNHLEANRNSGKTYVVVIDDMNRWARHVVVHYNLKDEIQQKGATLECLSFEFSDTPEGRFQETMVAAAGQYQKETNTRTVKNRMVSRMESGFWCFPPPSGYKYTNHPIHKKIITPIKKDSKILKEALEGYAYGRFNNKLQIKSFLEEKRYLGKKYHHYDVVSTILTQPLYAGLLEYPKWGISLMKAKHKGIISFDTYRMIQKKLARGEIATRTTDKPEFPLRRLVKCAFCGRCFTSSYVKGKLKYFPYYTCNNSKCPSNPKNILNTVLEDAFKELCHTISPQKDTLLVFTGYLKKEYDIIKNRQIELYNQHRQIIDENQLKINGLLESIEKISNPLVIQKIECKISLLEEEIQNIKLEKNSKKLNNFESKLDHALKFIEHPYKYWNKADLNQKYHLFSLIFLQPPTYDSNRGFRTPELRPIFAINSKNFNINFNMVDYVRNKWNTLSREILLIYETIQSINITN